MNKGVQGSSAGEAMGENLYPTRKMIEPQVIVLKQLTALFGSPGRIRTYNPAVNSRMLYR